MKSPFGFRVILFLLVLVTGTFDRHLSGYFQGEVKAMVHADAMPAHSDIPVNSFDSHEDITLKTIFSDIPAPLEVSSLHYWIFRSFIPRTSPHAAWQPPEPAA
jgi:hypothetical protein